MSLTPQPKSASAPNDMLATDKAVAFSRLVNIAALLGLLGVLTGSLALQFWMGEQPCPLCLIQRSAMIGLAVGPLMNLLWGMKPIHYALAIFAALTGAAGSTRQILLHLSDSGYGPPVMGLHLYTWALITFIAAIGGCAAMLLWSAPFRSGDRGLMGERGLPRFAAFVLSLWLFIYLLIIGLSVIPECGTGMCPDNPANIVGLAGPMASAALLGVLAISVAIGYLLNRYLPEVSNKF